MSISQIFRIKNSPFIAVLALLAFCPPAFAQSGFYLGAGFGQSDINQPGELLDLCREFGIECNGTETGTQFKGLIGYQFGRYFGVELTGYDVGEPSIFTDTPIFANAKVNLKGGSISLLPQFPVGDLGYIYGRIGATAADATLTAEAPGLGLQESDSTGVAGLIYGFGGGINIGQNISLRLEWERYSYDEVLRVAGIDIDAPKVDVISGSFIYRFTRSP
jgi:hypothetical protein